MKMSTNNTLGYCPICKQNVLLVREAVNWSLIIILIIFTGGIGLIVYGIVYFNKTPSRCIHCRSQIALDSISNAQSSTQSQTITRLEQKSDFNAEDYLDDNKTQQLKFCSFCGEALLNKDAMFCAHCGTKV